MGQSSESFRQHGPHAVRPRGATVEPTPRVDMDALLRTTEPPPSSNGPTALRGEALVRALARLHA